MRMAATISRNKVRFNGTTRFHVSVSGDQWRVDS